MYGWIWKHLPGNLVAKIALSCGLIVLAGLILWYQVFPRIENYAFFADGTVN